MQRTRLDFFGTLEVLGVESPDCLGAQAAQRRVSGELDRRLGETLARSFGTRHLALQRIDDQLAERGSPFDGFDLGAPEDFVREIECRSHSSRSHRCLCG